MLGDFPKIFKVGLSIQDFSQYLLAILDNQGHKIDAWLLIIKTLYSGYAVMKVLSVFIHYGNPEIARDNYGKMMRIMPRNRFFA